MNKKISLLISIETRIGQHQKQIDAYNKLSSTFRAKPATVIKMKI